MSAEQIAWTGGNTEALREFCDSGGHQWLFVHLDEHHVLVEVWSGGRWVPLSIGDVITRGAGGGLTVVHPQRQETQCSDSPHAADAIRKVPTEPAASDGQAITHALLAIADELAEQRRQRHSDAIDLANAVSALTGKLDEVLGELQDRPARVGWLRHLIGGAR